MNMARAEAKVAASTPFWAFCFSLKRDVKSIAPAIRPLLQILRQYFLRFSEGNFYELKPYYSLEPT